MFSLFCIKGHELHFVDVEDTLEACLATVQEFRHEEDDVITYVVDKDEKPYATIMLTVGKTHLTYVTVDGKIKTIDLRINGWEYV